MQGQQLDENFIMNDQNEESFDALERYTMHEVKERWLTFDDRFSEPNQI